MRRRPGRIQEHFSWGLQDLFLVEDKVEDGSELNYEECDVDEAELASFLCKKPDLALFSIESSRK